MNKTGTLTALPELLSWDVCRSMGEPCDWFEVSFIYYSSQLPALRSACRFRAVHGSAVVFEGIVDEYSVSIDDNGSVVTLSGRSDAALLLDNELPAAQYASLTSAALVNNFIAPYGVSDTVTGEFKTLSAFTVTAGESAWSAVRRFCRYAWGTIPFFDRSGAFVLSGRAGSTVAVNAEADAAKTVMVNERYGVISDITVRNRVTGASATVENTEFKSLGGSCHRELTVPKTTGADAVRYTADYQIAESKRGKRRIELTLTKQFAAFPGDVIALTALSLGVSGSYTVTSAHCWADSFSGGTVVTLEV